MPAFKGFPEGKSRLIQVPEKFFQELLPQIDHLGELKLTLYCLWRLNRMEGAFRWLRREDFLQDRVFLQALGEPAEQALDEALQRSVQRGVLLPAQLPPEQGGGTLYFLNSPKGRAAVRLIAAGEWRPEPEKNLPVELDQERPNIYQLYEENFGPLTPLLADALKEAETSYPVDWIEDAIRIAVENNKRNWRYVTAILERWRREGRHDRKKGAQDRGDSAEDRRRYVEGEYADFIEH